MVRPPEDAEKLGIMGFVVAVIVLRGLVLLLLGLTELMRSALLAGSPVVGNRWSEGIGALIVAALFFYVAYGITQHSESARITGVVVAIVSAIVQLMAVNTVAIWSLVGVGLDVLIIYALCVHGERFYKKDKAYDGEAMG